MKWISFRIFQEGETFIPAECYKYQRKSVCCLVSKGRSWVYATAAPDRF